MRNSWENRSLRFFLIQSENKCLTDLPVWAGDDVRFQKYTLYPAAITGKFWTRLRTRYPGSLGCDKRHLASGLSTTSERGIQAAWVVTDLCPASCLRRVSERGIQAAWVVTMVRFFKPGGFFSERGIQAAWVVTK